MKISRAKKMELIWKLFLSLAFVFLALSFLPGEGIIFAVLFLATVIALAYGAKRELGSWGKAVAKIEGFFLGISKPLAITMLLGIIVPMIALAAGVRISNADFFFESEEYFRVGIVVLAFAPFLEEIFFRAFILNYSKKLLERFRVKRAEIAAVLFSSVLFSLAHNLSQPSPIFPHYLIFFALIFLVGVIYAYQFLRKGLVSTIWLHGLYNLWAVLLVSLFSGAA